ncbi:LysR family transcriptional regulator [Marivita sp.]|uniref:LysR family transcriptional regulator n=1 Tax=Marivita sp. TaxID=2003365 RepID=UPI0025B7F33F|nr:LysR family transcriptional regulator [Marivita sp.]
MDIRQLQTLVAVADTRSFAASSRIVNLTPSAISQQIQSLEGEIGVEIFDRTRRPPILNAKGEEIVRAARQIVQIMAEARQSISGGSTAGVLKIGSIRTISMRIVPQAFARTAERFPNIAFHLTVGMSEDLLSDVAAGRLDAAVVAEHVDIPGGLIWTPILEEPLLLVAPPDLEGLSGQDLLKRLPFIRYDTKVPLARQIDVELSRLGVEPQEIVVANTMPSVVGCVLAGLGVAVVPTSAIHDKASADLYVQSFGDTHAYRRVGLVQRQVCARAAVLSEMANILSEQAMSSGLTTSTAAATS